MPPPTFIEWLVKKLDNDCMQEIEKDLEKSFLDLNSISLEDLNKELEAE